MGICLNGLNQAESYYIYSYRVSSTSDISGGRSWQSSRLQKSSSFPAYPHSNKPGTRTSNELGRKPSSEAPIHWWPSLSSYFKVNSDVNVIIPPTQTASSLSPRLQPCILQQQIGKRLGKVFFRAVQAAIQPNDLLWKSSGPSSHPGSPNQKKAHLHDWLCAAWWAEK